jgi:hypothetical protein
MSELMLIDRFLPEPIILLKALSALKKLQWDSFFGIIGFYPVSQVKNKDEHQEVGNNRALTLYYESLPPADQEMLFQIPESNGSFIEFIASISLWRLIILVLKRIGSLIKSWLKDHKVVDWLRIILHGAYLSAFETLYFFIYILHLFRAFLTLIKYFTDQDNKNLVEVYKFLLACFKVFISLVMLAFMMIMMVNGIYPFGLIAYQYIKTIFYIYTYSKTSVSLLTLVFSFYKLKTYDDNLEHAWEKENYKSNTKKHLEILLVSVPLMILLTLVSSGIVAGPLFYVTLGIASVFFVIDVLKAIYYYKYPTDIPYPKNLPQKNPFIKLSSKDYYWRKCRDARLSENYDNDNRFLLGEILIKIQCLNTNAHFFFEKSKIEEKIKFLTEQFISLLLDRIGLSNYQAVTERLTQLIKYLKKSKEEAATDEDKRLLLLSEDVMDNVINGVEKLRNNFNNQKEDMNCEKVLRLVYTQPKIGYLLPATTRQSFFRRTGDCEDIERACNKLLLAR